MDGARESYILVLSTVVVVVWRPSLSFLFIYLFIFLTSPIFSSFRVSSIYFLSYLLSVLSHFFFLSHLDSIDSRKKRFISFTNWFLWPLPIRLILLLLLSKLSANVVVHDFIHTPRLLSPLFYLTSQVSVVVNQTIDKNFKVKFLFLKIWSQGCVVLPLLPERWRQLNPKPIGNLDAPSPQKKNIPLVPSGLLLWELRCCSHACFCDDRVSSFNIQLTTPTERVIRSDWVFFFLFLVFFSPFNTWWSLMAFCVSTGFVNALEAFNVLG